MPKHDVLGRFKVITDGALVAPGKCAVCGTVSAKKYVDFGLDLDFYGVVYICADNCFTELANNLDYYNPAQWDNQMFIIEALRTENNQLKDRVEALDDVVNSIGNLSTTIGVKSLPDRDTVTVEQKSELSDSGPKKIEHGSTEQTDESGSASVFSLDRDDLESFNL